jgi:thiol-disulfide isomerase/thioredoxin
MADPGRGLSLEKTKYFGGLMRFSVALALALFMAPLSVLAQAVEGLHPGDMAHIRDSYKNRPLVMHVWSLTCTPCLAELPKWAERIKRHPEIAFVFINTDGIQHAPALTKRLQNAGVKPTQSLVYADNFVERLQYEISPDWHGELPRNELISRSGESAATLGLLSDTNFEKWVRRSKR